jgi:hypothetical protein
MPRLSRREPGASTFLGEPLDPGPPRIPLGREALEPTRGRAQALGPDRVAHLEAAPAGLDEPGAVEDREVLDDGGGG